MDKFFYCHFPNLGFVGCDLEEIDLKPIKDEIDEIYNNFQSSTKWNSNLVGHIRKEFKLTKCSAHLEKIALRLAEHYKLTHRYADTSSNDLCVREIWVNFQEKYEFNPLHTHNGEFVFVLWIKVPYNIDDEVAVFPDIEKERNNAGHFSFQFINTIGQIQPWLIPVDKSFEGKMIMFPASLSHQVYPFYTSDEYRISISGNLFKK